MRQINVTSHCVLVISDAGADGGRAGATFEESGSDKKNALGNDRHCTGRWWCVPFFSLLDLIYHVITAEFFHVFWPGFTDDDSNVQKSDTLKRKVVEEKRQREHILQLNQILAKQVMEKSKMVAGTLTNTRTNFA